MRNDVDITPDLVREHGLKPDEYQRFVDLIGPHSGRAVRVQANVANEFRPLVDHAEAKAEAELGGQIKVSGGKAVARYMVAPGERGFQAVQHLLKGAIARAPRAALGKGEAERLIGPSLFEGAGAKEQPAVIVAAIAWGRRQPGFWEGVG